MATASRIRALPKVELHVHLDGSVLPETIVELAELGGISLPERDPRKLLPYMGSKEPSSSLSDYLEKFSFVGRFLHSATALERVAFELVGQLADDNCRYVEVRFAPQLHRQEGLSVDEAIVQVLRGLSRGEASYGVKARCIVICLRGHSDEMNQEAIEAAARFRGKGVVAVDLAGSEADYPPEQFVDLFALARGLGLPITIHAGEAAGAESVKTAIESLGASRIGHGVRAGESPELLEEIRRKGIPLELCPISNIQTRAAAGWHDYPIREYDDLGIRVTINTDNLTVSQTTLSEQYETMLTHFGFTEEKLCKLVRRAAEAAFLPEDEKAELLALLDGELDEWLNGRKGARGEQEGGRRAPEREERA